MVPVSDLRVTCDTQVMRVGPIEQPGFAEGGSDALWFFHAIGSGIYVPTSVFSKLVVRCTSHARTHEHARTRTWSGTLFLLSSGDLSSTRFPHDQVRTPDERPRAHRRPTDRARGPPAEGLASSRTATPPAEAGSAPASSAAPEADSGPAEEPA